MEMNQVEAFVTIARTKGFSRAATILHLSQPAVSRRIGMLEQELGVVLFDRVHGGVELTEVGHTFLPFARQILAAARDGIEAIQTIEEQEKGTVKLALVGSLASTGLTSTLRNFKEAYAQVNLILRTALSDEISAFVQNGDVHIGLRYFSDSNPNIISQMVEEEVLVVVGSPNNSFISLSPLHPADLKGVPWVSYPIGAGSSGEPFAKVLKEKLYAHGLSSSPIIPIDSLTAQKRLVEADFGIGLMPVSSIQEELQIGTLVILDILDFRVSAPVHLLYRKQGYLSHAAKKLIEEIKGWSGIS